MKPPPSSAAYQAFYKEHAPAVIAYLRAHVALSDVLDVAQETWAGAWAGWPPPPDKGRAWVIGIARHKAADHHVARSREKILESYEVQPATLDPRDVALAWEIEKMLQAIPDPEQREALVLDALGFSAAEIGGIQGCSEDAAHKRIQRARARARGALPMGILAPFDLDRILEVRPEEVEALWERMQQTLHCPDDAPGDASNGEGGPATVREPKSGDGPGAESPEIGVPASPATRPGPRARVRLPSIARRAGAGRGGLSMVLASGVTGASLAVAILLALRPPRSGPPPAVAAEPSCAPAPAVPMPACGGCAATAETPAVSAVPRSRATAVPAAPSRDERMRGHRREQ